MEWNGSLYGPSAGDFTVRSGNTTSSLRLGGRSDQDHLTILSDGKVGIGTTSPTTPLTVNGAITASQINLNGGGAGGYWNVGSLYGPNAGVLTVRSGNATSSLRLGGRHDQDHLTILSDGSVGIGTSTPTSRLDVVGSTVAYTAKVINSNATTAPGLYVQAGRGRIMLCWYATLRTPWI